MTMNANPSLNKTQTASTEPEPTPTTLSQYDADARAKIAVLRAMAADFALPEPRSLTSAERRIVTSTPRVFVEKAANFGEMVPGIGTASNADYAAMLDAEAYAQAYAALIDEIEALRQRVRKAVALRRLRSALTARSIYRMGKNYVLVEGGDNAKTHLTEMRRALNPRRRAVSAAPPAETPTNKPA